MFSSKSRKKALFAAMCIAVGGLAAAPGCSVDEGPGGVRAAVKTGGPTVTWDMSRLPLPEIPLPNDIATWPDPTSRTGRRINASLVAPTLIERNARQLFSKLEGFGTYAPISIPFDKPLDTDDIKARHVGDDYDFRNDAVYVINIKTGVPVPLDLGSGNFPVTLRETNRYWANDPAKGEANLLFETREEDLNGNGILDPGEDTDFDGVLDHPNFPGHVRPANGVDGLLTFFESESNTLVIRPVIPLEQMSEYAVVVTDRLHGSDPGKTPIQSPFDWIHHPEQRGSVQKLSDSVGSRSTYFGFADGLMAHASFVFTFTTQPTALDLFTLRDGIYGKGPAAWLAQEFPAKLKMFEAVGLVDPTDPDPSDWLTNPDPSRDGCRQQTANHRFVAKYTPAMKQTVKDSIDQLFSFHGPTAARLLESFDNVDYLAVASMDVPWLLGNVKDVSPDATIDFDPVTGKIPHTKDTVTFFIVVPKATPEHKPPFPVAFYGHGYTGNATEGLLYAGDLARHGIATVSMNAPGHGLDLGTGELTLAKTLFANGCVVPFADGFLTSRVRDLNGTGNPQGQSGADYWTAYLFHTRDMVRQAVVEQMMVVKALHDFDGVLKYDWGAGADKVAGDFDQDGTIDIGGPNVKYYAWGESLGGILSSLAGGVDPYVSATAPTAGGGALLDIGVRSFQGGVVEAVDLRILGPLVVSVPAETRIDTFSDGTPKPNQTRTKCAKGQRSVRWVAVDLNKANELEIACADETQLTEGDDVVVYNRTNNEVRCAQVTKRNSDAAGHADFRAGIPASVGDQVAVTVFRPASGRKTAMKTYGKTCEPWADSKQVVSFDTWQGVTPDNCTDSSGGQCATWDSKQFHAGTPLVSPSDGYGIRRQSPDYRKLMSLAGIALEPADPITFMPYYYLKGRTRPADDTPQPPTGILNINTIGDMNVPVNTGIATGRVHGSIPFLRPDNVAAGDYPDYVAPQKLLDLYGGKTPNQYLLDSDVIEGIARLGRHPAGAGCAPNVTADATLQAACKQATTYGDPTVCLNALFDIEYLSEGGLPYAQQHASTPLRLGRLAKPATQGGLEAIWAPRLSAATGGWGATDVIAGTLQPYIVPQGVHGFDPPDPCKKWDDGQYLLNIIGHFFRSGGTDLYYLSHPTTHGCAAVTEPTDPAACKWGD